MASEKDFGANVMADLKTTTDHTYFVLTASARAFIRLIQFMMRLYKEGKLSEMEIADFQEFGKLVEGNYSIHEVPLIQSEKEVMQGMDYFDQQKVIAEQLKQRGIHFCFLPDFSEKRLTVQIAVADADKAKFAQFMEYYTREHMVPGKNNPVDMKNLAGDQTSIVNINSEMLKELEPAMEKCGLAYSIMPDLNLSDTSTQLMVLNKDLSTHREIYDSLAKRLMGYGQKIEPLTPITQEQYQATGERTVDDVINGASEENRNIQAKYDKNGPNEISEKLQSLKQEIGATSEEQFISFSDNPEYTMLSVDDGTLVNNPSDSLPSAMASKDEANFYCRVPGTWGKKEEVLAIPKENVFLRTNLAKPSYYAFIKTNDAPIVYTPDQKAVEKYTSGKELYETHFSNPENYMEASIKSAINQKVHNFEERTDNEWNVIETELLVKDMTSEARTKLVDGSPDVVAQFKPKTLAMFSEDDLKKLDLPEETMQAVEKLLSDAKPEVAAPII